MEPITFLFAGHGGHLAWVSYWMWAAVVMAVGCLVILPSTAAENKPAPAHSLDRSVAATWIDKGLAQLIGGFTPNMFEAFYHSICQHSRNAWFALGVYAVGALVLSLLWRIAPEREKGNPPFQRMTRT